MAQTKRLENLIDEKTSPATRSSSEHLLNKVITEVSGENSKLVQFKCLSRMASIARGRAGEKANRYKRSCATERYKLCLDIGI